MACRRRSTARPSGSHRGTQGRGRGAPKPSRPPRISAERALRRFRRSTSRRVARWRRTAELGDVGTYWLFDHASRLYRDLKIICSRGINMLGRCVVLHALQPRVSILLYALSLYFQFYNPCLSSKAFICIMHTWYTYTHNVFALLRREYRDMYRDCKFICSRGIIMLGRCVVLHALQPRVSILFHALSLYF